MIWIMLWDVLENDMLLYLCDGFLRNVPCMIYPKGYVHYFSLFCFVCYPWPILVIGSLIARFLGPTWGPPGAERTQVGPLSPWTLLSGILLCPAPSIHLSVPQSVCPSRPCYQSTTHNIQRILCIYIVFVIAVHIYIWKWSMVTLSKICHKHAGGLLEWCLLYIQADHMSPDVYSQYLTSLRPHDANTLIARFMGPTWGPPGAARTQVSPMLATGTLLSGYWWLSAGLQ